MKSALIKMCGIWLALSANEINAGQVIKTDSSIFGAWQLVETEPKVKNIQNKQKTFYIFLTGGQLIDVFLSEEGDNSVSSYKYMIVDSKIKIERNGDYDEYKFAIYDDTLVLDVPMGKLKFLKR